MTEPQDPNAVPGQPTGQQPPGGYPPPPPPPGSYPPPPPPIPAAAYGQPAYGQPAYGQPAYGSAKTNTLAIVGLVLAFVCAPAGIVLGFVAKSQIRQRGEKGGGLATAAIIVGFVLIALNILLVVTGAFGGSSQRGY